MAAEYEIKEVGFIGSLWQGEFNSSLNIGKTAEITNVLNTIESGRRQSIFLSTEENIDIEKLNKQLPDDNFYYEIGSLGGSQLDDLATYTKIDKQFLANKKVLFRYNKRALQKNTSNSIMPIQENWSFDVSDLNDVEYIYNTPESILFVNYVFLVGEQYRDELISYFSGLEQENFILATPPELQPTYPGLFPEVSTVMPPPKPFFDGSIFGVPIVTEEEIERLAVVKFENAISVIESEIPENEKDPLFLVSTTEDVNKNIKLIDNRIIEIRRMIQENSNINQPFSNPISMKVEIVFLSMVRNYLFDRLREINDVGFPDQEPERYSVDEEGNISVEPRIAVDPPPVIILQDEINKDISEFDDFIDEIIEDLEVDENNTYVFKKISKISDYDLPTLRYKTKGLFRCTGEKLSTFHTGSLTEKQSKYYLPVFNEQQNTTDSYHQFDVTYCHISGSGSSHIEGEVDLYPAKSMYRKYMLECFGNTNGKFQFKNGINGDYFYAIQLNRDAYKEKIDVGNFEIALCQLSSSGTSINPSSSVLFTLIDESSDTKQEIVTNEGIQEYYYITSGSLRDGVYNEPTDNAWGIVFPKMGLIILDGVVLDQSCSFSTVTSSIDGQNTNRLFLSISGAAVPTSNRPSGSFFARSFETFLTETYFCRADFNEFNTSTNYTYISGSNGFMKYDYFSKEPQSFITTIGLYNKRKELLAVGKLRNPIRKNDGRVCVFEVVVRLN